MTNAANAPRKNRLPILLRSVSRSLLIAGVLAVGYSLYVVWSGRAYQAMALRKIETDVLLAEPHLPNIGEAIGVIQIPAIGLENVVLYGDSPQVLRLGIGHLPDTAMPGDHGNVVLAGHRDTFFRPLRQLHNGDLVTLRTQRGSFLYRVDSTAIVSPKDVWVLQSSGRSELTLLTCYPFDYVGPAPNRFVVRAIEVARPVE